MEQALALDAKNGNTLWSDAVFNKLQNVKATFKSHSDWKKAPLGHHFVQCHVVFDIKMEDFRHEARLVEGDHMTEAPATIIYEIAMSRETVRIILMIEALNYCEVRSGDILNEYVQASVKKRCEPLWVLSLTKMWLRLQ